jgi:AcrR family transcriptional regulator
MLMKKTSVGRPRSEDHTSRILKATLRLLEEVGYAQFTIEGVATRAKVGRPTVYRRFPTKAALVLEALKHTFGTDPAPDTGDLRQDLLEVQRDQVAFFNNPTVAAIVPGLMSEIQRDKAFADMWWRDFVEPRRQSVIRAVERAADRGEVGRGGDIETLCDVLTGPLICRAFLHGPRKVPKSFAFTCIDLALHLLPAAPSKR